MSLYIRGLECFESASCDTNCCRSRTAGRGREAEHETIVLLQSGVSILTPCSLFYVHHSMEKSMNLMPRLNSWISFYTPWLNLLKSSLLSCPRSWLLTLILDMRISSILRFYLSMASLLRI
ncbi:hypothetical protein AKJ16_DCAP25560 [Drosera capensis]